MGNEGVTHVFPRTKQANNASVDRKPAAAAQSQDCNRPLPVVPRKQRTVLRRGKDGAHRSRLRPGSSWPRKNSHVAAEESPDEHDVAEALFCLSTMAAREELKVPLAASAEKKSVEAPNPIPGASGDVASRKRPRVLAASVAAAEKKTQLFRDQSAPSASADIDVSRAAACDAVLTATVSKEDTTRASADAASNSRPGPHYVSTTMSKKTSKSETAGAMPMPWEQAALDPKPEGASGETCSDLMRKAPQSSSQPQQLRPNSVMRRDLPPGQLGQLPVLGQNHESVLPLPRPGFKRCAPHVYIAHFIEQRQKALYLASRSHFGDGHSIGIGHIEMTDRHQQSSSQKPFAGHSAIHATKEAQHAWKRQVTRGDSVSQVAAGVNAALSSSGIPTSVPMPSAQPASEYAQVLSHLKPSLSQQFQGSGFPFSLPPGHAFASGMPYVVGAGGRAAVPQGQANYIPPGIGLGLPHLRPGISLTGTQSSLSTPRGSLSDHAKLDLHRGQLSELGLAALGGSDVGRVSSQYILPTSSAQDMFAKHVFERAGHAMRSDMCMTPEQAKTLYGITLRPAPQAGSVHPSKRPLHSNEDAVASGMQEKLNR